MRKNFFILFLISVSFCGYSQNSKSVEWNNKGLRNFNQQNYKGALIAFSKALELDSTSISAYNNRGVTYTKLEQFDLLKIKFIVNQDAELYLNLDIKVFKLIQNIKNGYLPNRSLHNEFTKLDEFIRELINATSKTKEIRVFDKHGTDNLIAEAKKGRRGYTVSGSIF